MSTRPALLVATGLFGAALLALAVALPTPGVREERGAAPTSSTPTPPAASSWAEPVDRWVVETMRTMTAGEATLSLHLKGNLDLQRTSGRRLVGRLANAQVAATSDGLDTTGLGTAFAVRLDPRGRPAEVGFGAGVGPLARRLITNLIAEVIVPEGARGPAIEEGPAGRVRVRYAAADRTVTRTVEAWVEAARLPGQPLVRDLRVEVLAGTTSARFDDGGLASLTFTERLRYRATALDTISDTQTTAERVSGEASIIELPADLAWEGLAAGTAPGETAIALDRALLDGADFADLTADIGELGPRARGQRVPRLAALFRLDPAAVTDAVAAIRAGSPGAEALLGALSAAGTPAAQAALAELLADAGLDAGLRKGATIQLGLVDAPTVETAEALQAALDDEALAIPAALALGSVARAHPEHVAALRAGLARATDADTLRLYLDALGNAADAGAHDALLAALDHADAHVRAAAAYGLRGLEGDDVDATLTRVASQDPAPEVRRRAEQALAVRARR